MASHEYRFHWKDLLGVLGPTSGVFVGIVLILQALFSTGLTPSDRPVHDLEHLILTRQWERSFQGSSWVLIGDSSALMDVHGWELGEKLGHPVRQLGTLSLLDVTSFFRLGGNCLKTASDPHRLVLLVNPEFLARPAGDPDVLETFEAVTQGRPRQVDDPTWPDRVTRFLALDRVRDVVESRIRPFPLRGAYGVRYGFHTVATDALEHEGGLVDPGVGIGRQEPTVSWTLSPRLEPAFRAARKVLPDGTRILIGITPIPETLAGTDSAIRRDRMLETIRGWIGGDTRILHDLPVHLPTSDFAQKAHLREDRRSAFTARLASAIQSASKD